MPKISVVVPVYNAEKTLRKCVESIIFGKEKDVEVILVEDHSQDNSWELCNILEKEYIKVKCIRNECNKGVSFTRNQGLSAATGQYVMFVDSDDWVSGSYAKLLIDTSKKYPDMLCICGFNYLDYTTGNRRFYGIQGEKKELCFFKPADYPDLVDAVLLQSPCNKLFSTQVIHDAGIYFDETISMGEDFQFVIDYLKATACIGCLVINRPLYYYIRHGHTSLMSHWGDVSTLEKSIDRMKQMQQICGDEATSRIEKQISQMRHQFGLKIARDRSVAKSEKLKKIEHVLQNGHAGDYYRRYKKVLHWERLASIRNSVNTLWNKALGRIRNVRVKIKIKKVNSGLITQDITIISQNCIGGVLYHDMGLPFQSPTVNLFIPQPDFIRFVNHLEYYLTMELEMHWVEEYPIGRLDDVEIHFVHYDNCLEARDAWERRKQRVQFDRIVVLSTDRDGFTDETFEMWKRIKYPKTLFTANRQYASNSDAVFFPEYEKYGCIPDIIPSRKFYKNGNLLTNINSVSKIDD